MNNKLTLGLLLGLLLVAPACSFFKADKKEATPEALPTTEVVEIATTQVQEDLPENPMTPTTETEELK